MTKLSLKDIQEMQPDPRAKRTEPDVSLDVVSGPYRAWFDGVQKFGLGAVIAAFLIWFITFRIDDAMKNASLMLAEHVTTTKVQQTQIMYFLRGICLNTAHNETERANCPAVSP